MPPPPPFGWSPPPLRFTARGRINEIVLATRWRPSLLHHHASRFVAAQEGGEAPKGACQPFAAPHQQALPPADTSGAAARHIGARPPSGASTAALAGTPIPAQLQAMLPGTWNQAGVTRSILSQCSDSTSRLGRSTEGNDARSRSGADCEPARKHRTRSTLQIASRNASLDERDFPNVTERETNVKTRLSIRDAQNQRGGQVCANPLRVLTKAAVLSWPSSMRSTMAAARS